MLHLVPHSEVRPPKKDEKERKNTDCRLPCLCSGHAVRPSVLLRNANLTMQLTNSAFLCSRSCHGTA